MIETLETALVVDFESEPSSIEIPLYLARVLEGKGKLIQIDSNPEVFNLSDNVTMEDIMEYEMLNWIAQPRS